MMKHSARRTSCNSFASVGFATASSRKGRKATAWCGVERPKQTPDKAGKTEHGSSQAGENPNNKLFGEKGMKGMKMIQQNCLFWGA